MGLKRIRRAFRTWTHRHRDGLRLLGLAAGSLAVGLHYLLDEKYSLLVFLLILSAFLVTYTLNLFASISLVLAYLFVLGDVRRVVNSFAGFPTLDPLLLIGPLFTILLALPLILKARVPDAFSKVALALLAVMTLEIINPHQGGIGVGLAGALFYIIPVSWFWIGRQYCTPALLLRIAYRVVLPLAVLAALLGFYQTYIGVLPWQEAWVKHALESGYAALSLGKGHIRSFGFSVNSVEYGCLLEIGSILCFTAGFSGRRAYLLLAPLLLFALVLASMRGLILRALLAVVIVWAVRGPTFRSWATRLVIGIIVGFGALSYSARHAADEQAAPAAGGTSSADLATSHVAQGLAHPLDPTKSTAGLHGSMILGGFSYGLRNPLGGGIGINGLGAGKFGGAGTEATGSSEFDVSDAFITMGFVGGPLYLAIVCMGFVAAGRIILAGQRETGYLLIGLFVGMLGGWLPLGQYAAGPFMWFCIGYAAKLTRELELEKSEAQGWDGADSEIDELLPASA